MKILTIGSATEDIFIRQSQPHFINCQLPDIQSSFLAITKGSKSDIEPLVISIGGAATNAAATFNHYGYHSYICSIVGSDQSGTVVCKKLEQKNINLDFLQKSSTTNTTKSFIFSFPDGERSILTDRGAQNELSLHHLKNNLGQFNALYVSGLTENPNKELAALLAQAKEKDIFVAINPGSFQLKQGFSTFENCLSSINVLITNTEEAKLLFEQLLPFGTTPRFQSAVNQSKVPQLLRAFFKTNTQTYTLHDYFSLLHGCGIKIAVVTDGKNGVYMSNQASIYYHQALSGTVVNTVGAGDAFGSTFVAALLDKKSIEEAMMIGLLNSKSVINKLDAQSGLLSKTALLQQLQVTGYSLIQIFPLS
jgi:sugar/nucleoside kinase (ribokinase family)